jgi:hypothetical protein
MIDTKSFAAELLIGRPSMTVQQETIDWTAM